MKRSGYTIVELLIVIAIIGLLTTLGTYVWNSSGKRSRDSVRKSDLSRMENALQQFYLENRAYPEFGNQAGDNIFSASYQLADGTGYICPRGAKNVLTPKYLPSVPQDPKNSVNPKSAGCPDFINQASTYLYLAGGGRTVKNPRDYALMATLEMSENDRIDISDNPVLTLTDGIFRDYHVGSDPPTNFDPNYMVTGSAGR